MSSDWNNHSSLGGYSKFYIQYKNESEANYAEYFETALDLFVIWCGSPHIYQHPGTRGGGDAGPGHGQLLGAVSERMVRSGSIRSEYTQHSPQVDGRMVPKEYLQAVYSPTMPSTRSSGLGDQTRMIWKTQTSVRRRSRSALLLSRIYIVVRVAQACRRTFINSLKCGSSGGIRAVRGIMVVLSVVSGLCPGPDDVNM